jgi:hypothetical protein
VASVTEDQAVVGGAVTGALRSAGMAGRSESMAAVRFDEGRTYFVHQLHVLDANGKRRAVQDAAVVFTPGWLFVQEAGTDGYVLPRERVLLVEGVKTPR